MGVELFNEDGRTNMTKIIVVFRSLGKAPKSGTRKMRMDTPDEGRNKCWDVVIAKSEVLIAVLVNAQFF